MTHPTPDPIGPGQESVWTYPRPPRVEPVHAEIKVFLGGMCIAWTKRAQRVLETSHPPVYFLPAEDVDAQRVRASDHRPAFCEFKGIAHYLDINVKTHEREVSAPAAAFTYANPIEAFAAIAGHISFYAGAMDACTINGVVVTPQPGGFYSGWITPEIVGPFKGYSGTEGW